MRLRPSSNFTPFFGVVTSGGIYCEARNAFGKMIFVRSFQSLFVIFSFFHYFVNKQERFVRIANSEIGITKFFIRLC
jgi:hypothetical protein